ncbi:MAG: hypothetical protein CL778_03090 [Chloroflexi bacterium]|nr:hypothetical protein [Chloroflexota bacterium]|tara:strand:+ start:5371 stop:5562 length:192 start_codon:yes stop_codon:yes gene_type:complete
MYVFLITIIVIFSICVVLYPILFSNEINKNEHSKNSNNQIIYSKIEKEIEKTKQELNNDKTKK